MPESVTKPPASAEEKESVPPATMGEWPPTLDRLREEIDRIFDDFGRGTWRNPFQRKSFDVEPFWRRQLNWNGTPAVDIVEKDDAYELTAELPGMDEEDIDVHFSDGMLVIKGEKKEEKEEKKKDYYLSERHFGSFRRSFRVPEGVNTDGIDAQFRNGVLRIALPKTEQAKKEERKIAVKAA